MRSPTPKRVPHKVPNAARRTFRHVCVLHRRFMGCPIPQYGGFKSFRVYDHRFLGCPIPQCSCSSRFVFHRVPNRGTLAVPTTSTSPVTLWLCVVVCLPAMRGTACTRWSQAPHHSITSYALACAQTYLPTSPAFWSRYSSSPLVLVASVPLKLPRVSSHFSLACFPRRVT